jgi:hypothetical protein
MSINPALLGAAAQAQIKAQIGSQPRKSKYRSEGCRDPITGAWFHSKAELRWHKHLEGFQTIGVIANLNRQVRFDLHAADGDTIVACYVADWTFDVVQPIFGLPAGSFAVVDLKGQNPSARRTAAESEFMHKRELFLFEYAPQRITVIDAKGRVVLK